RASAWRSRSPSPSYRARPQVERSTRSPAGAWEARTTSGTEAPISASTAPISGGTETAALVVAASAAVPRARETPAASAASAPPQASTKQSGARFALDRGMSVGVQLDAQELAADEEVVAVGEVALALDAHVGAVAAVEVGEGELAAVLFDAAVGAGHVEVHGEVEVAALAADLEGGAAGAHGHADGAPLED